MGAKGGIAFSIHWICFFCFEHPRTVTNGTHEEGGGDNRQQNNQVWDSLLPGSPCPQPASRPGFSPSTNTRTHSSRQLLPWEPTPLWLFPSQENNRHQSSWTSRSLFQCKFLSSLFLGAVSLHPSSSPGPAPSFLSSSSSSRPGAITHVLLFPSSARLWQSWVWFVMCNLSRLGFVQSSLCSRKRKAQH